MEIYQVVQSREADQDLESIAEYIAQDSPARAFAFVEKFQKDIQRILSVFPQKHRRYKDCHVLPYGNYLVLYDINFTWRVVEVLGIVNAAQYLKYRDRLY